MPASRRDQCASAAALRSINIRYRAGAGSKGLVRLCIVSSRAPLKLRDRAGAGGDIRPRRPNSGLCHACGYCRTLCCTLHRNQTGLTRAVKTGGRALHKCLSVSGRRGSSHRSVVMQRPLRASTFEHMKRGRRWAYADSSISGKG
jgi:hypothetical protein